MLLLSFYFHMNIWIYIYIYIYTKNIIFYLQTPLTIIFTSSPPSLSHFLPSPHNVSDVHASKTRIGGISVICTTHVVINAIIKAKKCIAEMIMADSNATVTDVGFSTKNTWRCVWYPITSGRLLTRPMHMNARYDHCIRHVDSTPL